MLRRDVEGKNLASIGMENETEMCTGMSAWCGNQYPYPRISLPVLLPTTVEVSSSRWRLSGKAGIKKKKIEGSKNVPGSVDALALIPCGWVS